MGALPYEGMVEAGEPNQAYATRGLIVRTPPSRCVLSESVPDAKSKCRSSPITMHHPLSSGGPSQCSPICLFMLMPPSVTLNECIP